MGSIFKKDAVIGFDSKSSVQDLTRTLTNNEETLEGRLKTERRKAKDLSRRIRSVQRELRDYLRQHGEPQDIPFISAHPNDPVVPDTAPEDSATYVDNAEARTKSFPDATFLTFVQAIRSKFFEYHNKKLALHDKLVLYMNEKSKAEGKIQHLENLLKRQQEYKKKNQAIYEQRRDILYRVLHMIESTEELKDLFEDFPDGYTVDDAIWDQDVNMERSCIQYRMRKRRLIDDLQDFGEDFAEVSEVLKTGADITIEWLQDETVFPKQFTQAVVHKTETMQTLDAILARMDRLRMTALEKIKELSGRMGVPNEEVQRLLSKVESILSSTVREASSDQTTMEQQEAKNRDAFQASVEKVNQVKQILEAADDRVEEFVGKIKKRVLDRMANVFGFGKRNRKPPDQSLEDYWRETVRNKYGGNIPFCDEVEIIENGDKVFIKKEDAVEKSPGVWVRKSTATADEYKEKYGTNASAII